METLITSHCDAVKKMLGPNFSFSGTQIGGSTLQIIHVFSLIGASESAIGSVRQALYIASSDSAVNLLGKSCVARVSTSLTSLCELIRRPSINSPDHCCTYHLDTKLR